MARTLSRDLCPGVIAAVDGRMSRNAAAELFGVVCERHPDVGRRGQGYLLSGPPSCGKTLFARAMATTCGVPLITGSYGEWLWAQAAVTRVRCSMPCASPSSTPNRKPPPSCSSTKSTAISGRERPVRCPSAGTRRRPFTLAKDPTAF